MTNLQQSIHNRLQQHELNFVVREYNGKGYSNNHYVSAAKSWFGKIPLHLITKIFSMKTFYMKATNVDQGDIFFNVEKSVEYIDLSDLINLAESTSIEPCVMDESSRICIYKDEPPTKIITALSALNNKIYKDCLSKVVVYLRDFYYTDKTATVDLKIKDNVYKISKVALNKYGTVNVIGDCGSIGGRMIKICSKQRDRFYGCNCNSPHETTLEDLITRIVTYLQNDKVQDLEPCVRTQLLEDSWAAREMGLLKCGKW